MLKKKKRAGGTFRSTKLQIKKRPGLDYVSGPAVSFFLR
jgi:hypothetical protein